jgi:hypothetical protein
LLQHMECTRHLAARNLVAVAEFYHKLQPVVQAIQVIRIRDISSVGSVLCRKTKGIQRRLPEIHLNISI